MRGFYHFCRRLQLKAQYRFWFGQSDCTMTRAMTNNHTSSKCNTSASADADTLKSKEITEY